MKPIIVLLCLLLFASCHSKSDVTCTVTNPVFTQSAPDEEPYQSELIKQLNTHDRTKLHYYVDNYVQRNGKPFMYVTINGDGLCAELILDIKNPNKLQVYKNVKGIGYKDAEITGMQFGIDSTSGKYLFLFEEGVIVK